MIQKYYSVKLYNICKLQFLNIMFVIWGKLLRAHQTKSGHSVPAYLGGSNKLRTYLFFIYGIGLILEFVPLKGFNIYLLKMQDL